MNIMSLAFNNINLFSKTSAIIIYLIMSNVTGV